MKHLLSMLLLCLVITAAQSQQVPKSYTTSWGLFTGFYEFKPYDYSANPTKKYPVIIFLHGAGEKGNGTTDLPRVLANGIPKLCNAGATMKFTVGGVTESFIVLSPQLTSALGDWNNSYVDAMLEYAASNLRIDPTRIYLTGLSLGGGGTWTYVTLTPGNATKLAAIVPIAGNSYQIPGICYMSQEQLPVWAFHALDDPIVGAWNTQFVVGSMNNCSPKPNPVPLVTYYPTGGHAIWDRAYDTSHAQQNPNIYEWFLMHQRGVPNTNIPPIANAGSNVSLVYPTSSTTLSAAGSSDADGTIAMYTWTRVLGPDNYTLANANAASTTLSNLVTGTYIFQVKVTDYMGGVDSSRVTVQVNPSPAPNVPPVASAGTDQVTTSAYVNLNGYSSFDPDGYIVAFDWKQVDGPTLSNMGNITSPAPTMANLSGGLYHFEVDVFDNLGAMRSDTVAVFNSNLVLLPVVFDKVSAARSAAGATIEWSTSMESNTDHFDIQRSVNGSSFVTVGTLKAAGNSANRSLYTWIDTKVPSSTVLYRIAETDRDGKTQYTKVVVLNSLIRTTSIAIFPNPVTEVVNVTLGSQVVGKGRINLLRTDGMRVKSQLFAKSVSDLTESLNVRELPAGIYMIEVKADNGFEYTQKIVKQ